LLSDFRSAVASSHDLLQAFPLSPLAETAIIPDPPANLQDLLTPALPDEKNPPLTETKAAILQ
jgi:hypothetical protein